MKYLYGDLTDKIIKSAITVHKELGPGHPEKIYQRALKNEFERNNIIFIREKKVNVSYTGKVVGYEILDFLVFNKIALELKAVKEILNIHIRQVMGYLKAANLRLGLIINFGKSKIEIKRVII